MARSVVAGDCEGGGRNVRGDKRRAGKFFRQRNGDTAGAGADVRDLQSVAIGFLRAARAKFTEREAVKRHFDDVLGFRTRNENVLRDFELESPKLLLAGEVLRWLASSAPG